MFNTTSWKEKAGLMALGSFFTIIGLMLSPITAEQDKFGEIECESLKVNGSINCKDMIDSKNIRVDGRIISGSIHQRDGPDDTFILGNGIQIVDGQRMGAPLMTITKSEIFLMSDLKTSATYDINGYRHEAKGGKK